MTLGKEEKLEQLEKLLRSRSLHDSETLKAFLRFVVTKSIECEHEHIKEYVIATALLGRDSNYDPNIDSAVRVHARRLRAKLQEYYATEGKDDKVVIDLPKGHYTPSFSHVQDENKSVPAEVATPSIDTVVTPSFEFPHPSPARWLRPTTLGLVTLTLIIGALAFNYRSETRRLRNDRPTQAADSANMEALLPLWSEFLRPSQSILIAYSNTLFERGADDRLKYVKPLDPPAPSSVPPDKSQSGGVLSPTGTLAKDADVDIIDFYTGVGEVMGVSALSSFFSKAGHPFRVKRSLLLNWDDLKTEDIVILGSPQENLFLRQLPQQQDFIFEPNKQLRALSIVNLNPRAGEPRIFVPKIEKVVNEGPTTLSVQEDYALVSVLKGLGGRNRLMILAGVTTYGTQAAAEYVTKPEHIQELIAHLQSSPNSNATTLPSYYQVLLKVKVNGGVPVQISYVTHHVLK